MGLLEKRALIMLRVASAGFLDRKHSVGVFLDRKPVKQGVNVGGAWSTCTACGTNNFLESNSIMPVIQKSKKQMKK